MESAGKKFLRFVHFQVRSELEAVTVVVIVVCILSKMGPEIRRRTCQVGPNLPRTTSSWVPGPTLGPNR